MSTSSAPAAGVLSNARQEILFSLRVYSRCGYARPHARIGFAGAPANYTNVLRMMSGILMWSLSPLPMWRSARFAGLNCGLSVEAKAPWAQVREGR